MDAYDAKTGKRAWRTYTMPAPANRATKRGPSIAGRLAAACHLGHRLFRPGVKSHLLGDGQTWPRLEWRFRPGDNLYTCSVLALDANTGKIKWHFQFTPHDVHDWDATEIPVLFDATVNGRARKLLAMANRNAFYYLLDRENGQYYFRHTICQTDLGGWYRRKRTAEGETGNGTKL